MRRKRGLLACLGVLLAVQSGYRAQDGPVEVKLASKVIKDSRRILSKSDAEERHLFGGGLFEIARGAVLPKTVAKFSRSMREVGLSLAGNEYTLACGNGVVLRQGGKSKKLKRKAFTLNTVKLKLANGLKYALAFPCAELRGDAGVVYYRSGCELSGSLAGTPLALYDDNLDGSYTTEDCFSTNKSTVYAPWSEYIPTARAVYRVGEIPADASKLAFTKFEGETGKIAVKFSGKGLEGNFAFGGEKLNFTSAGKGKALTALPGSYRLLYGLVYSTKLKRVVAGVSRGEMGEVSVESGKQRTVSLGKPFSLVFSVRRNGRNITIQPFFEIKGRAGEIYAPLKILGIPTVAYAVSKKKTIGMGSFGTC